MGGVGEWDGRANWAFPQYYIMLRRSMSCVASTDITRVDTNKNRLCFWPVGVRKSRTALAVRVRDAIGEVVSEDAIVRIACRACRVCRQIAVGIIAEIDAVQRGRRLRMGLRRDGIGETPFIPERVNMWSASS